MPTVAPISQQIWDMKYRLKGPDGDPVDKTIEDTWARVAKALAAAENDPAGWEPRFYQALEDFRFLPAGRILAGAGADRNANPGTASARAVAGGRRKTGITGEGRRRRPHCRQPGGPAAGQGKGP